MVTCASINAHADASTKIGADVDAGYQTSKLQTKVGFWMPGSQDDGNGTLSTLYAIVGSIGVDFVAL